MPRPVRPARGCLCDPLRAAAFHPASLTRTSGGAGPRNTAATFLAEHAQPPNQHCRRLRRRPHLNESSLLPAPPSPTAASAPPVPTSPPIAHRIRLDGWLGLMVGPLLLVAVLLTAIWVGHNIYTERERSLAVRTTLAYNAGLARLLADDIADTLRDQIGSGAPLADDSAGHLPARLAALTARLESTAPLGPGMIALHGRDGRIVWQSALRPASTATAPALDDGLVFAADGSTRLVARAAAEPFGLVVSISGNLDEVIGLADTPRSNMLGWGWSLTVALLAGAVVLVSTASRQHRLYRALSKTAAENSELITRLRDEKSRAYQLASHDHLTGLPNRMLFTELANSHLTRARRSHAPFVMMFLDLDRFKRINDTVGHRIGDLLLQEVARRLRDCMRETDIVARLGGDEFVLLLTELDNIDDASRIATKLIDAIAQPMLLEGHDIEVRPSIGIAIHPRDGIDVETMMRNADSAMYEAKRSGSGRFYYYDPSLNSRSSLQLDLSSRFRRAILGNEFVLHYQPRVALNGFRITSLEALIRWQHPERGLVLPGEFIEYAEQEGLVVELGNWVVRETCRQIAAWVADGLDIVPIAINVSPKQLRDHSFVEVIRESVAHYGIRPELLEIEITERCVVEDFERPRVALEMLSALGLKIALDDYGTGFSSLSYLKRLPIDIIKIDRSFISDIRNQTNDAAIVASTIALGHNLGLTVIAEGVETREQVIYLRTAGCDEVQGYYFQKPAPADAIRPLLAAKGTLPAEA